MPRPHTDAPVTPAPRAAIAMLAIAASLLGAAAFAEEGDFAGFEAPVLYDLPSPARSIRAGDLDEDGDVDLVMTHLTGNSVSILFNNGDGTFESGPNMPVAIGMGDSAITDFDGDGIMDIIAVSQGSPVGEPFDNIGRVAILRGLGGGEFAEPEFHLAGFQPVGVAAGDLNGDGHPDFAVTNQLSGDVAVFLNNGDGTPGAPVFYQAGSVPVRIALADLNLDGSLDIVVVNNSSSDVSVFMNDGDGVFETLPRLPTTAGGNRSLSIDDINNDGYPEVAIPTGLVAVVAIHFNDRGSFTKATNYPAGMDGVATATLDRFVSSGFVDASAGGRIVPRGDIVGVEGVLEGDGQGILSAPASLFPTGEILSPLAQCAADFDDDGDIDLAASGSKVSILLNRSASSSAVDLTGDGVVDSADLAELLRAWGQPGAADFDKSGAVDGRDLAHLLANWSAAP